MTVILLVMRAVLVVLFASDMVSTDVAPFSLNELTGVGSGAEASVSEMCGESPLGPAELHACLMRISAGSVEEAGSLAPTASLDALLEAYKTWHDSVRHQRTEPTWLRYVVCEPYGGIGNHVNAIMSCFAYALASGRFMLMHWNNQAMSRVQVPPYTASIGNLFPTPPFNWTFPGPLAMWHSVDLSQDHIVTFETTFTKDFQIIPSLEPLLCDDLTTNALPLIVNIRFHSWFPCPLYNPFHKDAFARVLGEDQYGGVPFVSRVGPWLLRPPAEVAAAVSVLHRIADRGTEYRIGLQVRLGVANTTYEKYHDRITHTNAAALYVRCGLTYLPRLLRTKDKKLAWMLVADTASARDNVIEMLASMEGGVESEIDVPAAAKEVLSGQTAGNGAVQLLAALAPRALVFKSGARLITLTREVDLTLLGMLHSLSEMFLLAGSNLLVKSENSSYGDLSSAFGTKRAYVVTTRARCYPLPSREPIGNSGLSMRMSRTRCYDDRMLTYPWTWLPGQGHSVDKD